MGNIKRYLVSKEFVDLMDSIVGSTPPEINTGVCKLDPKGKCIVFCGVDQRQNRGMNSLTVNQVLPLYMMMRDKMRAVKEEVLCKLGRKHVTLGTEIMVKEETMGLGKKELMKEEVF